MGKCAQICEVFSRVCGYFRPISNWNRGKQEEFKERKLYRSNPMPNSRIVVLERPTQCRRCGQWIFAGERCRAAPGNPEWLIQYEHLRCPGAVAVVTTKPNLPILTNAVCLA